MTLEELCACIEPVIVASMADENGYLHGNQPEQARAVTHRVATAVQGSIENYVNEMSIRFRAVNIERVITMSGKQDEASFRAGWLARGTGYGGMPNGLELALTTRKTKGGSTEGG